MKLAIAQNRSIPGAILTNLQSHRLWINLAVQMEADAIAFPELSLTGYAPSLTEQLALSPSDTRLAPLQQMADRYDISIGVGLPTRHHDGVCISLVWFHPHVPPQVYAKQHLHPDEAPLFISGNNPTGVITTAPEVAIAICYELSVPEHVDRAVQQGARVYLASVAKSASGLSQARERLRAIAQQYAMPVILVNCVGPCEDFDSAGGSAIWDHQGHQLAQLDSTSEGLLLFDTATAEITASPMSSRLHHPQPQRCDRIVESSSS